MVKKIILVCLIFFSLIASAYLVDSMFFGRVTTSDVNEISHGAVKNTEIKDSETEYGTEKVEVGNEITGSIIQANDILEDRVVEEEKKEEAQSSSTTAKVKASVEVVD